MLPPIVEAYLAHLQRGFTAAPGPHIDVQTALASILYTLCKVRGAKVIVGFLNNEPRYLEPVLAALEHVSDPKATDADWKVPYVLLLWLSHLLLAPFDLASISAQVGSDSKLDGVSLPADLPPVATRIVQLGLKYLSASTKAQDAAASMLVRLVTRPDMQKLRLADALVDYALLNLHPTTDVPTTVYQQLGPLRFLAGISSSADLGHLIPQVYRACERLTDHDGDKTPLSTNAVGKRLIVKVMRNIAILALRSASATGHLLSFLETTSVLEDVIDYLLRSLGDRDTPVRYATAKAISLIVSELDPAMGHEVIQAVLDTFKEDMPRSAAHMDYSTVNALKWHGLTLALSHALFKRSASPEQLPDILDALVSALNFEQRTATGSSVGTNVRDAANFGIWSLSRRYTTDELLSVNASNLRFVHDKTRNYSVIQAVAIQLLLSACLDPAGNIRRGSSAALQELIGRHPDQVYEGIALVQIVEYQAVGLRRRGMIDVAESASKLHRDYWRGLVDALPDWRGLGSPDVASRDAAAESVVRLATASGEVERQQYIADLLLSKLVPGSRYDMELAHGIVASLALLLGGALETNDGSLAVEGEHRRFWNAVVSAQIMSVDFSPRMLRSELLTATAKLAGIVCSRWAAAISEHPRDPAAQPEHMDDFVDRLMVRQEDSILQATPFLAQMLVLLKRRSRLPLGCLGCQFLCKLVAVDGSKAILNGAGRAIALGTLAPAYGFSHHGLTGEAVHHSIFTLAGLVTAMNVDWRIIGLRALHLALEQDAEYAETTPDISVVDLITQALHTGLNDYTIDERGDVGSLVRLQALTCVDRLLSKGHLPEDSENLGILQADILRLSLEKLDRVRARAATVRVEHLPATLTAVTTAGDTGSETYIRSALGLLRDETASWMHKALLQGVISCAGISSEALLQTSRRVLAEYMYVMDVTALQNLLTIYTSILQDLLTINVSTTTTNLMYPALELLAFLLDMRIPQRLCDANTSTFKWRTLLSVVQKSHHKSSDIPKLLAAVHCYRGLAEVPMVRTEVIKKLLSMLKTNPYPKIRVAVAEALWVALAGDEDAQAREVLRAVDWGRKGAPGQKEVVDGLAARFVDAAASQS